MNWLKSRWAEPESRAAAAGILTAAAGYASGTLDAHAAALAAVGCVLAFVFPGSAPAPHP
jgi:hypothetical protein